MNLRSFARHGAVVLISLLLATLAAAAPLVNSKGAPPRSVFLRLPSDTLQPALDLDLRPQEDGRFLLRIVTRNFTFTDICVSDADAVPVGHAHVIVDGVKVASAYDPVVVIGPLAPGAHEITVVLRGQDHRALLGEDGLVKADVTIEVS